MTTNDTSGFVRWLVIIILTAATVGMFLISMRANYLYGRGIGQTPETKEAIAWANVGADLWKGFGLIVVAALWRGGRRRAALATSLTWLVCLFFSVTSAIGIYVQERTALTGGRVAKHASYEDTKKQLDDTEAKLKRLGQQRTSAQVEAAIAAVLARPVMVGERVRGTVATLSANCTKNDARTAEACGEVAELREELAAAHEAAKLDARAATLRQQLHELRERGGTLPPDPVGEFWAWLTRGFVTVTAVGFGSATVLRADDRAGFRFWASRHRRVCGSHPTEWFRHADVVCRGRSRRVAPGRARVAARRRSSSRNPDASCSTWPIAPSQP